MILLELKQIFPKWMVSESSELGYMAYRADSLAPTIVYADSPQKLAAMIVEILETQCNL